MNSKKRNGQAPMRTVSPPESASDALYCPESKETTWGGIRDFDALDPISDALKWHCVGSV